MSKVQTDTQNVRLGSDDSLRGGEQENTSTNSLSSKRQRDDRDDSSSTAAAAAAQQAGLDELEFNFGTQSDNEGLDGDADNDPDVDAQLANGNSTALASAKLSSKKKEALSQVPCKFFRSNGCSAGNACPFAHIQPGEGHGKAICQWFLKGNCRFGHRCALAHILPGQPMSMDRKNKRAAQQQSQNGMGQQHMGHMAIGDAKRLSQQQHRAGALSYDMGGMGPDMLMRMPSMNSGISAPFGTLPMPAAGREGHGGTGDLMFGMPDDLQYPSGQANASSQQQQQRGLSDWQPAHPSMPPSKRTFHDLASTLDAGVNSASHAFGTSPFSQPGSLSLFYSGVHNDGEKEVEHPSGRSHSRTEEDEALHAAARKSWGEEKHAEEFLPSSLSDLLTPAELERRRKSVLGSKNQWLSKAATGSSAAGGTGGIASQSMPANGLDGGVRVSSWNGAADGNANANDSIWSRQSPRPDPVSTIWNGAGLSERSSGGLSSRAGASNTSTGYLSARLQGGDRASSGEHYGSEDRPHYRQSQSYTSDVQAAMAHAPGQSLPQGLAAGLSRLHLHSDSQGIGGIHASRSRFSSDVHNGNNGGVSSSPGVIGGSRTGGSNSADELAPIAPSSIFALRGTTPLHQNQHQQNSARSIVGSVPSTSASFDAASLSHSQASAALGSNTNGTAIGSGLTGGTYGASPYNKAYNGQSNISPALRAQDGIAIPGGGLSSSNGASKSILDKSLGAQRNGNSNSNNSNNSNNNNNGVGVRPGGLPPPHHRHPGMHRLRGTPSGAGIGGSPLALATTGEEVEDAIFELE